MQFFSGAFLLALGAFVPPAPANAQIVEATVDILLTIDASKLLQVSRAFSLD